MSVRLFDGWGLRWRWMPMGACTLAMALLGASCDDPVDALRAPDIRALMPQRAAVGAAVEILGEGFCGDAGDAGQTCAGEPDGLVSFSGGVVVGAAVAQRWSDSRITVAVPDGAAPGDTLIVVEVDGVPSRPAAFSVVP